MVRKVGYWPKMQSSIGKILSACLVCQQIKKSSDLPVCEMKSHQVSYAGQTVSIDLVGPLPRSSRGSKYILTMVDLFFKWVVFVPLKNATAKELVQALEHSFILEYGAPQTILSDNGPQMMGSSFAALLAKYRIKHLKTPRYCPKQIQ